MDRFYLEEPSIERKEDILDYLQEFVKYNSNINGSGPFDKCLDGVSFEDTLELEQKRHDKDYAFSIGRAPSKTYCLIRSNDNKIIGMSNIRYSVSEEQIKNGATHIGYAIRPTERQKGYNKIQLYLDLLESQKLGEEHILLDCTINNIGSNKTIQALGGILSETKIDSYDNELTNYYWINVRESIEKYKDIYEPMIIKDIIKR